MVISDKIIRLASYFAESTPLYLVGGSVRNSLLGIEISDYDACGGATVDEVRAFIADSGYRIVAEYRRTGTVVIDCDGEKLEYTTFREDSYPLGSGTHEPSEVRFTRDIEVDAKRRDFTCNAIYYDVQRDRIVDPVRGESDIRAGVLRAVRGEETLKEDALRILRMVRFALQLGFCIDSGTYAAAKKYVSGLADISVERVRDELDGILNAGERYSGLDREQTLPSRGLDMLVQLGAMNYIIPELVDGIGIAQNEKYHRYDVYRHILHTVDNCPPHLRLAGLMHDIAKPQVYKSQGNMYGHDAAGERLCREIMTRLKYPVKETERTAKLVSLHMFNLDNRAKDSTIRLFIAANYEYIDDYIALRVADGLASRAENFDRSAIDRMIRLRREMIADGVPVTVRDMDINGRDLIALGYSGTEIGDILGRLLNEQVSSGERYSREYMLARYRR